jgi:hypothetical protein
MKAVNKLLFAGVAPPALSTGMPHKPPGGGCKMPPISPCPWLRMSTKALRSMLSAIARRRSGLLKLNRDPRHLSAESHNSDFNTNTRRRAMKRLYHSYQVAAALFLICCMMPVCVSAQSFHQIPGKLSQISVGSYRVWGINASQDIFQFDSSAQRFRQVPGKLTQIAVGGDGTEVWGITANQDIFRFDFGAEVFKQVPGKLVRITVGGTFSTVSVWGINATQDIFQFDPGSQLFSQVPGKLTQISVFEGSVWGINASQDIFRLSF